MSLSLSESFVLDAPIFLVNVQHNILQEILDGTTENEFNVRTEIDPEIKSNCSLNPKTVLRPFSRLYLYSAHVKYFVLFFSFVCRVLCFFCVFVDTWCRIHIYVRLMVYMEPIDSNPIKYVAHI